MAGGVALWSRFFAEPAGGEGVRWRGCPSGVRSALRPSRLSAVSVVDLRFSPVAVARADELPDSSAFGLGGAGEADREPLGRGVACRPLTPLPCVKYFRPCLGMLQLPAEGVWSISASRTACSRGRRGLECARSRHERTLRCSTGCTIGGMISSVPGVGPAWRAQGGYIAVRWRVGWCSTPTHAPAQQQRCGSASRTRVLSSSWMQYRLAPGRH